MENRIYLIICLFVFNCSFSQNVIEGKVILNDLLPCPGVNVYSSDEKLLTTTDLNGNFKLYSSEKIEFLRFRFTGMYDETVTLNSNCNFVQVVMFEQVTRCFISENKNRRLENRDRKARNKAIPKLLNEAVAQKIFDADKMCNQQKITN